MQPIANGTKQFVVTYRELNENKMSKMQYHFHPKISLIYCILLE